MLTAAFKEQGIKRKSPHHSTEAEIKAAQEEQRRLFGDPAAAIRRAMVHCFVLLCIAAYALFRIYSL